MSHDWLNLWPVLKIRRSLYNNVAANQIFLHVFFFFCPRTINRTKQQLAGWLRADVRESWTLSSCLRCGEKPLGLRRRSAISVSFSCSSPPSPRPFLARYHRRALAGVSCRSGLLNKTWWCGETAITRRKKKKRKNKRRELQSWWKLNNMI